MIFRVGFGYDVHRFSGDRKLILGGIEIPFSRGLLGHSDADVLIHAICDALLGAAAIRDIGFHFPDADSEYKNADSKVLLKKVVQMLHNHQWKIGNIDCTVVMQAPKIAGFIPVMQETLAGILCIEPTGISIKATTTEGLGFTGREEGVAAYAIALIQKEPSKSE